MTQAIPKHVWRESYEQADRAGEGITRTTDPGASYHWVMVIMRGAPPMASYVRATGPRQAEQFCIARHPGALYVKAMEMEAA